ncbi:MAG: sulfotransferase [Anaerolineales bacterium]|nr:sulfotransferase [Anaerolineales bacterium]
MTEYFKDRPIFICGHPKSGTSLLRNLLDNHPQLAVYPEESRFFRNFLPKAEGMSVEQLIELGENELIHIFAWTRENPPAHQAGFPDRDYSFISYDAVKDRFRDLLRTEGLRHHGDVLWTAVQSFAESVGSQPEALAGWVEKTPNNEYFADRIFAWWPQAKCIHIVRDPRDNYASYQRKQESWSPGKFSAHWNRSVSAGFRNQAQYGEERYWVLRYEDLVNRPEEILPEMCGFLGINDDEILRRPTRAGDLWAGNSMFEDQFNEISPAAVGRWKETLTAREAGIIQAATRKYRRQIGYRDEISINLRNRLAGWYWRLKGLIYDIRHPR